MLQDTDYSDISPGFAKALECVKEEKYEDNNNQSVLKKSTVLIQIHCQHKMKVFTLRATFYMLLGQHDIFN